MCETGKNKYFFGWFSSSWNEKEKKRDVKKKGMEKKTMQEGCWATAHF